MLMRSIAHAAGNHIRYEIDYSDWLREGDTLTTVTVVMDPTTPTADVVISGILVAQGHKAFFMLAGGSVNETFTLDVQATDSRGEITNDTIKFTIIPT